MKHGAVLAADLGGTTLRLALVAADGACVRTNAVPTPMHAEGTEADPAAWWAAFCDGVAALGDLQHVQAVALTGMTRTQIILGRDGPLRPALTWRHACATVPENLPSHPEAAQLNVYHPVARLLWLRAHEPAVFAAATAVVEPKDDLARRLTGRTGSDRVSAARLLAAAAPGPGGASLLAAFGLPDLLPTILEPGATLGPVLPGLPGALAALAGRPVVLAGHDSWACAAGLGALQHGRAYNISGTTEVFGVLSRHEAAAPGLLSVDWGNGLHQLGGPSASGGGTLAWAMGVLAPGVPVGPALAGLLAQPRAAAPLLFLPHLAGERAPFWDPALRGAYLGLTEAHGPTDLAVAVLEGVAFLNKAVLDRAEAALGLTVDEIRYGGGGAGSAAWAQIKADITGRCVVVTDAAEAGLLGAAIAGWRALGESGPMVHPLSRHAPGPARHAAYARLYALWCQAGEALRPISHALAAG